MFKRITIFGAAVALLAALLAPVAAGRLEAGASATALRTGGSTGMQLLATALANDYNRRQDQIRVSVAGGGSGAGITGVRDGQFDIGNSSRDKRDSDPANLVFTPVAREPFVVIVNPKNPIKSLTDEQIKAVLTGEVTNWRSVGWGRGGPIKVFGRAPTSGTFASCKTLFTGGAEFTSTAPALASAGLDRTAVANNTGGVACVTLAYLVTGQGKIKGLAVNGIPPTLQAAASGRYTYINNQYFVTRGQPSGAARTYINWVLTRGPQCSVVSRFALPLVSC
jgi:phosphate transport system substrate-binding protein